MLERVRSRLKYKLMLGFSAILLVALSSISLWAQLSARTVLIDNIREDQLRLSATRVAAAERLLNEIRTDLLFLARHPVIPESLQQTANRARLNSHILNLLNRIGSRYLGICLVDQMGTLVVCARMEAGHAVVVSPDAYLTPTTLIPPSMSTYLFDHGPVYVTVLPPTTTDNPSQPTLPMLRYMTPVYNDTGMSIGQLILSVSAQPIFDLLSDPDQHTRTIISDQDGTYIWGAIGSLQTNRPQSVEEILHQRTGIIIAPPDHPDTFTTYAALQFPAEGTPTWFVIYDQPLQEIFDPINATLLVNSVLMVLLLIVSLFITYALTRSIVRPLNRLAVAAERVAEGDFLSPITCQSQDEIGALAKTLDRTVTQLRLTLNSAESRQREAETLYATAIALSSTLDLHRLLDRILDELRAVVPYDSSTVQLVRGDHVEVIGAYGLMQPEWVIGTTFPLNGFGPNAEVARQRTTVILDDAPQIYACFNEDPYRVDPIRSWIGVPLIFGERLIGMITIDKYEPAFYTAEHARIATAFAAHAAIALENARLYEAVRDELAERRRSELAQLRLTAILEATTDVVGSADTHGRLLFLNNAGRRFFGLKKDENLIGCPIHHYVPNDTLQQIIQVGAPAAMRDGIWAGEITLRRSDGTEIPASQVIIAHRNADGQTEYFSSILRDISERLRAEEQLRQAQKMEAVGRLAGGVSHDFNNILTVIMGECDLLLHEPNLNPDTYQGLEQIRQAGSRAAALTRQLLAFSRRQMLQPATINLNEIIVPVEQMLRRLIGEDISLLTCLAEDLNAVQADPSQIEQVILNLCINGRDAMPHGGELHIITENVVLTAEHVSHLQPGNYVLLTVRDTGSGIDEAVREHIFEPFFTTKPRGKGTGLGLAIVHGIVQQSSGGIHFSTVLGQGTSFYVYLPSVAGQPNSVNHNPSPTVMFTNTLVLLVEDDDRVRRLAHQILTAHGITVLDAADGSAALRLCAQYQGNIDLLISDIIMPGGLNGVQLAAHMRLSHPDIKVLLMSGYTDDALPMLVGTVPNTRFIQKPFTPAFLIENVVEMLTFVND